MSKNTDISFQHPSMTATTPRQRLPGYDLLVNGKRWVHCISLPGWGKPGQLLLSRISCPDSTQLWAEDNKNVCCSSDLPCRRRYCCCCCCCYCWSRWLAGPTQMTFRCSPKRASVYRQCDIANDTRLLAPVLRGQRRIVEAPSSAADHSACSVLQWLDEMSVAAAGRWPQLIWSATRAQPYRTPQQQLRTRQQSSEVLCSAVQDPQLEIVACALN